MNFLIDARLPKRLAGWLRDSGHESVHTLDLPNANATSDEEIRVRADSEDCVVVTKDDDFVYTYLVQGSPKRLLLVSTGNISNNDLMLLFQSCLPELVQGFETSRFVEITRHSILLHE